MRTRWYMVPTTELHILVAGAVTFVVVLATAILASEHVIGAGAPTAIFTAALGYAWGAYNADRAADRRRS